jgi:hypothetical protein
MPILARACHMSVGLARPFLSRALADDSFPSVIPHICLIFSKGFENRRRGMVVAQSGP